ncbi:MAG: helix-turn-helix transcriptional regulator [Planctomycetes bacterium]|nr:helix-turn-helix transcriptional regulator [Planctomycetota bacterium]
MSPALPEALPKALFATAITCPSGWQLPAHHHDDHELVLVIEGRVETRMEGKLTISAPGSMKFHPRRIDHAERALDGSPVKLLLVAWREAPGTEYLSWPQVSTDRRGRLRMLLEWLIELQRSQLPTRAATMDALLHALTCEHSVAEPGPSDLLVSAVRAYVVKHLTRPIYLEDLAAHVSMSKFHFARVFNRVTGRSPMRFVREARVEAARTLLVSSNMPLRTIAPLVGFTDEFQLSRVYRQVTGQAPGSTRRIGAARG